MPNFIDLLRTHRKQGEPNEPTIGQEEEDHLSLPEEEKTTNAESDESIPASDIELLVEEAESFQADGSPSDSTKPVAGENDKKWLNKCIHHVDALFKNAGEHKESDLTVLSDHLKSFLASIPKHPDQLAVLELMIGEKAKKIHELYGGLVTKTLMLMLYAIKMGLQLKMNEDDLHALVMAGMLHHIGMAQVPKSIRNKKEKLTKEEFAQIALAPKLGAKYLQQCGISDKRILSATLQAKERFDGTGPTGLKGEDISKTARIISLLSMFEAMIHFRPYRKRMLPRDAIREILINHKKAYDPAFLKCLIDAISLYPVGTYVQLNSGDVGQVVRVHRRLPLRPVVHLTMDRHGNDITPRDINLQTQPNLMVERCMYREDLKDLSSSEHETGPAQQATS
jgi:hypothetical protein